jgi:nicotinamide-nucleotide adenylyltransferase
MNKNKTALWVGRFQFPHHGHFDGAKQIQEEGIEKILIGVGSAQEKNTLKNPFTFKERKDMLDLGLKKTLSIDYEIVALPDMPTDAQWVDHIAELFPGEKEGSWEDKKVGSKYSFENVFSGNPWVQKCFNNYATCNTLDENRVSLSASTLREKLGQYEDVSYGTYPEIVEYLKKVNGQKRLEQLLPKPRNPELACDAIIEYNNGIVLIDRQNEPFGLALPGGFIDYGESAENAVVRETKEETNLDFIIGDQLKFYSDPKGDPRRHIATIAYYGTGVGDLKAGDDAKGYLVVNPLDVESMGLAFPRHKQIVADYLLRKDS